MFLISLSLSGVFGTSFNIHNTYLASMQRVYEQRKVKHATRKKVNGWEWSVQTVGERRNNSKFSMQHQDQSMEILATRQGEDEHLHTFEDR